MDKIKVRVQYLNNVIRNSGNKPHELDLGIKLVLPSNFKLHGHSDYVERIEALFEYCLNKGFETYQSDNYEGKNPLPEIKSSLPIETP